MFEWSDQGAMDIVKCFHQYNSIVDHQLISYNDCVDSKLDEIINSDNPRKIFYNYNKDLKIFLGEIEMDTKNIRITRPIFQKNDGTHVIMTPEDARRRQFNYSASLHIDIDFKYKNFNEEGNTEEHSFTIRNVNIGKFPIMVRSKYCVLSQLNSCRLSELKECPNDPGGYFIINGMEKVIVSQERHVDNQVCVYKYNKSNSFTHSAEIKSTSPEFFQSAKNLSIRIMSKKTEHGISIKVNLPCIRNDIPLFILFRACGVISDKKIINMISGDDDTIKDLLYGSIIESQELDVFTQEDAFRYIAREIHMVANRNRFKMKITDSDENNQRLRYVEKILTRDFLPHMGSSNYYSKSIMLAYMVHRLCFAYLERIPFDTRDSYLNKRIDLPGTLLAQLFRTNWTKYIKDVRKDIAKLFEDGCYLKGPDFIFNEIQKTFHKTTIENGLRYSLSSGNWGLKSTNTIANVRHGVAQMLSRLCFPAMISHLRRVHTPIETAGAKLTAPRYLNATQWGINCPAETPEGSSVGILKNFSMSASVTIGISPIPILHHIKTHPLFISIESFDLQSLWSETQVHFNGAIIGITLNPDILSKDMRTFRRKGMIHPQTSIVWNVYHKTIMISTLNGRVTRPLLIVDNGNQLRITPEQIDLIKNGSLTWEYLINGFLSNGEACIEYLDTDESNVSMIAMYPSDLDQNPNEMHQFKYYTHCEIHPSLIFGVVANMIPFSDHNQSPRNTYQCAQGKQAMGIFATNYMTRMDTISYTLEHVQHPIVTNQISNIFEMDKLPSGMNVVVAIMNYTGYNQEDSLLFNRSSIERGLFRATTYRVYKEELRELSATGYEEMFCKANPSNTAGIKAADYDKLGEDGIIRKEEKVDAGTILIGKVTPIKQTQSTNGKFYLYRDQSVEARSNEIGIVDHVIKDVNADNRNFVAVRVRNVRDPKIGDKFASRHGQKGTIGIVLDAHDMPYTSDGIVPDIIVNSHAIPSRMTIGHLMDCIAGKVGTIKCQQMDGTPFNGTTVQQLGDCLQSECGFERNGNEVMFDAQTGRQIKCDIFIGPTYYQRLKHMVDEKIHSRSTGPLQALTRQPVEGRSRDGGLRFGEMEKDCLLAHGSSAKIFETTMNNSDRAKITFDKNTGLISNCNPSRHIFYRDQDSEIKESPVDTSIPYASKLLLQELMSMGIHPRCVFD